MQEPRPDTNFIVKCSWYIYLYSCKNSTNFNTVSIFKKTLLYLHNHNYVNTDMLH